MKLKSLYKTIGVTLVFILLMAMNVFGAEYSVNGQKYELKNSLVTENGVTFISIYDYINISEKEIIDESEKSVTVSNPEATFTVGDSNAHLKSGDSIMLYNAPILYNNMIYVPLRMPKEVDSNIIMYDTDTGNINIYSANELNTCVSNFRLNDYEIKADRLINLEKFLSLTIKEFDADSAQIDKSGFLNGYGKIIYTANDSPERSITVGFNNGCINQEDTKYPISVTQTTPDYVRTTSGDFEVTIYAKDEYSNFDDNSIYAEVKYIGNKDKIYAWGSSPCFSLWMSGEDYFSGGGVDDVAILYEWEKGEVKTYPFKFYDLIPEKPGEYSVFGKLDLTDDQSGRVCESFSVNKVLYGLL